MSREISNLEQNVINAFKVGSTIAAMGAGAYLGNKYGAEWTEGMMNMPVPNTVAYAQKVLAAYVPQITGALIGLTAMGSVCFREHPDEKMDYSAPDSQMS